MVGAGAFLSIGAHTANMGWADLVHTGKAQLERHYVWMGRLVTALLMLPVTGATSSVTLVMVAVIAGTPVSIVTICAVEAVPLLPAASSTRTVKL